MRLTTNDKGAIAEAKIFAAAIELGFVICKPMNDGRRYDWIFDVDGRLERVQCKWGRLVDDVIVVRTGTCRHTPRGYVRTTYTAEEIDAVAVYCGANDGCYYVPVALVAGKSDLRLRLSPARNNQRTGVTMAADYAFGAIAQLGERCHGMAEVAGSSPASSIVRG